MRAVITVSGWVAACVLAVAFFTRPSPAGPAVGEVRQDVILDPLPIALTNEPAVLWQYANDYRTSPGWITASNGRVYAGLADRVWSAPYTLPQYRHEISVYAGAGFGIGYTWLLGGRYPVGGALFYTGGAVRVFASAGWRW